MKRKAIASLSLASALSSALLLATATAGCGYAAPTPAQPLTAAASQAAETSTTPQPEDDAVSLPTAGEDAAQRHEDEAAPLPPSPLTAETSDTLQLGDGMASPPTAGEDATPRQADEAAPPPKEDAMTPQLADGTAAATADEPGAMAGFDAGALVGVSLPWLRSSCFVPTAHTIFTKKLAEAGIDAVVESADYKVEQQAQQIESMIRQGARIIVVGPVDGTMLGDVLQKAKARGACVIGMFHAIEDTAAVDCVVRYDSLDIGRLQGQALLDGLAKLKGGGPYNIELFGGGPADPNAPMFFEGAMQALQPKLDDGTLVVVSGQADFTQCATPDWDNSKAQARMDSLLRGFYAGKELHGALAPNDGIARAAITACEEAGREFPVTSGLDAENESVEWIFSGKQYSTLHNRSSILVDKTIEIIRHL
jgi:putative multiple sugar transport system substrate-binding protein